MISCPWCVFGWVHHARAYVWVSEETYLTLWVCGVGAHAYARVVGVCVMRVHVCASEKNTLHISPHFPDEHKLLLGPSASELFPCCPQSQLVRWKHITLQEVQVHPLTVASPALWNYYDMSSRLWFCLP